MKAMTILSMNHIIWYLDIVIAKASELQYMQAHYKENYCYCHLLKIDTF